MSSFTISKGTYGKRMMLKNASDSQAWSDLLKEKIPELVIIDSSFKDITRLYSLTHLKLLSLEVDARSAIDMSHFPDLEVCRLNNSHISSLGSLVHLKSLSLYAPSFKDLSEIVALQNLEELTMTFGKMENLTGIEKLKKLTSLTLGYCNKLSSLSHLGVLTQLKSLDIEACKKIGSVNELSTLTNLKKLHLNNCGPIESLKPLMGLTTLEDFSFWESTDIVDGDLSFIADHPVLDPKQVRFQMRKHYSHQEKFARKKVTLADIRKLSAFTLILATAFSLLLTAPRTVSAVTIDDGSLVRARWSRTQIFYVTEGKKVPVTLRTLKAAGIALREVEVVPYQDIKKIPVAQFINSEQNDSVFLLKNNKKQEISPAVVTQTQPQSVTVPQVFLDSFKTVQARTQVEIVDVKESPVNTGEFPIEYLKSPTLGGDVTLINATNDHGISVGRSVLSAPPGEDSGPTHAFIWDGKGDLVDLGTLGSASGGSVAVAINNNNEVVGSAQYADDGKSGRPFLYKNGKMTAIAIPEWKLASVSGINDTGVISGTYDAEGVYPDTPFTFHNGTVTELAVPSQYAGALASGINNRGDVIGQAWVAWDPFFADDILENNPTSSVAYKRAFNTRRLKAVMWIDGVMVDLNKLLPTDSYQLFNAVSINNKREITAMGWRESDDRAHVFVLKLPDILPAPRQ